VVGVVQTGAGVVQTVVGVVQTGAGVHATPGWAAGGAQLPLKDVQNVSQVRLYH
jgi:hypothetical protein